MQIDEVFLQEPSGEWLIFGVNPLLLWPCISDRQGEAAMKMFLQEHFAQSVRMAKTRRTRVRPG
jgi:hypothetical protein